MYIVFDLEATCWKDDKSKFSEIIEIGAVKLDNNLNEISRLSIFIKPTINPILSEFCKELTTITQENVNKGYSFNDGMKEFENWIGNEEFVMMCSWGFYDKKQIKKETEVKGYKGKMYHLLKTHISIKHEFAKLKNIKPCGMTQALKLLGIKQDGTHHRGIDDAINISKIFREVFYELKLSD